MEYICQECNCDNTYIKIYKANVQVRDKTVEVTKERRFCSECNSLVYDSELDNEFSKEAIRKYNELYGLPAQDIKNIRKKLNLSVEDFAKIIGCAKKTIVSYENGNSIPNDIYLVTIKTIMENPEVIKNIIDSNKERFTEKEYSKVTSKITAGLSNNFNNFFNKNDSDATEYNGYTSFSFDKVVNLIKILSKNGILKTKLVKEMFYVDFFMYKKYCYSLTGLEYARINYGPVPDDFEVILETLSKNNEITYNIYYHDNYEEHIIKSNSNIDENIFTDKEKKIINTVVEKFKEFNVSQIVEYSHNEKAFKDTNYKDKISYDYALDLRDF